MTEDLFAGGVCVEYRPDHNAECLMCDEGPAAHERTPKEVELLTYLRTLERLATRQPMPTDEFAYRSIAEYLLTHGRWWTPQALPPKVPPMIPRNCFDNAYRLARGRRFRYVEGIAHSIIPVEHAWCVDGEGNVIDPTWDNPAECAYFGVPFAVEAVRAARRGRKERPMISNWEHDYPLLKRPPQGLS